MKLSSDTKHSRYIVLLLYVLLFVLVLYLNIRTPMICDDFAYTLDFSTGWDLPRVEGLYPPSGADRIVHVSQIFNSMYYHRLVQGGRVVTHFFTQLFLLMPEIVFDITNSLMFVAQTLLINLSISRMCKRNTMVSSSVFSLVFAITWIFEPAFGEVNLWLDGAINYLWVAVAVLFCFYHSLKLIDNNKYFDNTILNILFVLFCFFAGTLHEVSGLVIFGFSACFIYYKKFIKKAKLSCFAYLSMVAAALGTAFIAIAPSEMNRYISHGSNTFTFDQISMKLMILIYSSLRVLPLFVVFLLLIIVLRRNKPNSEVNKYSLILLFTSFCSFLPFVMGAYIPARCFWLMTIILTMGIVMILVELLGDKLNSVRIEVCSTVIILVISSVFVFKAISDINYTYSFIKTNEQYIMECKENNIMDIELPDIDRTDLSMYSPISDMKYIDLDTPLLWPNTFMANYYGVDSISYNGEIIYR